MIFAYFISVKTRSLMTTECITPVISVVWLLN